jgi:hypothetical protein
MRNLFALVGAAVVAFAVIGWFRGWYSFQTEPTTPGHFKVNVDVNREKISTDVGTAKQVVADKLQGGTHPVSQPLPSEQKGTSFNVNVRPVGDNSNGGGFTLPPLPDFGKR